MWSVSPSWRDEYEQRAFKRDNRAAEAGLETERYVALVERKLRGWVVDTEVRIRVGEKGLISILRSGWILPGATTGTTGSAVKDAAVRIENERRIFEIEPDAPPSERPVYGYLEGSREGDPLTRYGPVVLGLDDAVRRQATFVLGDTLDATVIAPVFLPVPLDEPTVDAVSNMQHDVLASKTLADACADGYGYAEVQIHGPVSATAVKRVVYTSATQPSAEALEGLAGAGLDPIRVAGPDPGHR